jgi:hypothetical protein
VRMFEETTGGLVRIGEWTIGSKLQS